ncbi:uncharacterized protein MELLADRAFT_110630 [Melampsora larici-populina 98AG31]|uniref:Uncharacterized protein n=1 Tax=Melampsora larici-populina (strain 98AG31 / pathotype 3-4-7) TaxID=747676 RepID=F4S0F6_MELLP|nr:uncharacterized protein MELLADRAFT_110630 [Melampsora larici-populina 98AG31]EGG01756.1 hypothetical protein MELLADRAFT_110630 [Melampsora larici-populina 98AG31]
MSPPYLKAEPPSSDDGISESRKRPSTSFQSQEDRDQRRSSRPRLSSPSSKFQSQLERLQSKVENLTENVRECSQQAEEFEAARIVIEGKLTEDRVKSTKFSDQKVQREVRKEVIPQINALADQVTVIKRDLDREIALSSRLEEQVHRIESEMSREHVHPELSTKQMAELHQYIKEEVMRSKKDKTSPPEHSAQLLKDVLMEVLPHINGLADQLEEQVHKLDNELSREHAHPEFSTKQMAELHQYIKEEVMRSKEGKTSPLEDSSARASEKGYVLDEGKAAEIRGALRNLQVTLEKMLEHMFLSKEGPQGVDQ